MTETKVAVELPKQRIKITPYEVRAILELGITLSAVKPISAPPELFVLNRKVKDD